MQVRDPTVSHLVLIVLAAFTPGVGTSAESKSVPPPVAAMPTGQFFSIPDAYFKAYTWQTEAGGWFGRMPEPDSGRTPLDAFGDARMAYRRGKLRFAVGSRFARSDVFDLSAAKGGTWEADAIGGVEYALRLDAAAFPYTGFAAETALGVGISAAAAGDTGHTPSAAVTARTWVGWPLIETTLYAEAGVTEAKRLRGRVAAGVALADTGELAPSGEMSYIGEIPLAGSGHAAQRVDATFVVTAHLSELLDLRAHFSISGGTGTLVSDRTVGLATVWRWGGPPAARRVRARPIYTLYTPRELELLDRNRMSASATAAPLTFREVFGGETTSAAAASTATAPVSQPSLQGLLLLLRGAPAGMTISIHHAAAMPNGPPIQQFAVSPQGRQALFPLPAGKYVIRSAAPPSSDAAARPTAGAVTLPVDVHSHRLTLVGVDQSGAHWKAYPTRSGRIALPVLFESRRHRLSATSVSAVRDAGWFLNVLDTPLVVESYVHEAAEGISVNRLAIEQAREVARQLVLSGIPVSRITLMGRDAARRGQIRKDSETSENPWRGKPGIDIDLLLPSARAPEPGRPR